MRNRIFGAIGVLWGGAIIVKHFAAAHAVSGNAAYAAGQSIGFVFGILLLLVGAYFLFKNPKTTAP
jgi:hypothetical protein